MSGSTLDRSRRQNLGLYCTGQTGSGKSRRLSALAALFPRVVYVDPTNSFDADVAALTYKDWQAAANERWGTPTAWTVACQFGDDAEYRRLFAALVTAGRKAAGALPPVLLVIDEADMFCSPREIDPGLSWILRYGRHYGFSWCASARADVQMHRDVRTNAYAKLLYRQSMLSPEMVREIKYAAAVRGEAEPVISRLVPHGPDEPATPVEGRHYYCLPDPWPEVAPEWAKVARLAHQWGNDK